MPRPRKQKKQKQPTQALATTERVYEPYKRRIPTVSADHVVKVRQQQVLAMYADGNTVPVISAAMGMSRGNITRDLKIALNDMLSYWSAQTPQHMFVRYASFQMNIVNKLQETFYLFMESADPAKYGALVNSLRAQSDIFDKVMSRGVKMGVVKEDAPARDLPTQPKNIRIELRREIKVLERLLDEIDDHTSLRMRRPQGDGQLSKRRFTRVRKLRRSPLGFITLLPDWKYRRAFYDEAGNEIPKHRLSPAQELHLARISPDHEATYLRRQLEQQHGRNVSHLYDPQTSSVKVLQAVETRSAEVTFNPDDK